MVLIAQNDKPFVRVGKGTIVRRLTEEAYSSELKTLFGGHQERQRSTTLKDIRAFESVRDLAQSLTRDVLNSQELNDVENLYLQGLDSVKSMELIEQLKASLESQRPAEDLRWINLEFLYSHPTIESISAALLEFLKTSISPKRVDRVGRIQEALDHYLLSLPPATSRCSKSSNSGRLTVVLLGSTGLLGQASLLSLAQDSKVARVYCLDRSEIAKERFMEFLSWTNSKVDSQKIRFLHASLTKPAFGLLEDVYSELKNSCDVILHSAWQVTFTVPLSTFDDSLRGIVNSIELATAAKNNPRLVFISSIAATGVFAKPGSPKWTAPEGPVEKLDAAMETGYGESKLVAEHLLAAACANTGISASILRVGQIAPSSDLSHAFWAGSDAVTLLLRASKTLQRIPDDLMDADWVPVNTVVDVIRDVMHHDCTGPGSNVKYYNVVNPVRTPWAQLVPAIEMWCGRSTGTASFDAWLEEMKTRSSDNDRPQLPAIRLLPFFAMIARRGEMNEYQQRDLLGISNAAGSMKPVDAELLQGWLAKLW